MKRKFKEIDNNVDQCPICMESLQSKNLTITKCGHKFCHTCLDSHSCNNNKCPVCRSDLGTNLKSRKLCDCNCDIRYSVSSALNEAEPQLRNLTTRLIKNFFKSFSNFELNLNKNELDTTNRNELNQIICRELNNDNNFKMNIFRYVYEEIYHFSMINSFNSCSFLKYHIEST